MYLLYPVITCVVCFFSFTSMGHAHNIANHNIIHNLQLPCHFNNNLSLNAPQKESISLARRSLRTLRLRYRRR